MKIFKKQIIAQVGLDSCGIQIAPEVFKECVKNLKNKRLPITDNFDDNPPVGCMTNFEFKDGKIFANLNLLDDRTFDPIVSCAFEMLDSVKLNKNTREITKCKLIEGGLVDTTNYRERYLL